MANGRNSLHLAAQFLRDAKSVVVFTGAGVSAESGIATFRDADGFWNRFPPDQFANWAGLMKTARSDPRRLAEFLHAVIDPVARAEPNPAHRAIADLQQHKDVIVVTQNIDGLHQSAGSKSVFEIHGSLFDIVSLRGKPIRRLEQSDLLDMSEKLLSLMEESPTLPKLLRAIQPMLGIGLTHVHRPNLVLFGEAMAEPAWTQAQDAAKACDCLLTVGTSGLVQPAAMIPDDAGRAGATVIEIGFERGVGDIRLEGSAAEIIPLLVHSACAGN